MPDAALSRILTLVFADLAGSTSLKTQRGDKAAGELIARHRAHVGYAYLAMNLVALERPEEARAAIAQGRRVEPKLSLELMQSYIGVSRAEVDTRRNDVLREAGLE